MGTATYGWRRWLIACGVLAALLSGCAGDAGEGNGGDDRQQEQEDEQQDNGDGNGGVYGLAVAGAAASHAWS